MKPDYTHFTVVMDRSGSMQAIQSDTEGGLNAFFEKQKAEPGTATGSLTSFDDRIEFEYSFKDLKEIPTFTLNPRGFTALYDAIGLTLVKLEKEIEAIPENDRPEKVIVVIVTDGEENHSTEYTSDQIQAMIKKYTEEFKWEFVFLAANQDAIKTAKHIGIGAGKALSFATSSKGIGDTYTSLSCQVSAYRGMKGQDLARGIEFTDEDRQKQRDEGAL